ncbi:MULTISPECIES: hypothetical protein [unclassified Xanthomonas]|uniref:hypothetical protein n=1 Tax=Xanthomonas sp. LMG 9002 TaxID=1591158 RepID=UPI0031B6735C
MPARQDGGKNVADNVVAACHMCNLRRHKRPSPAPSAEVYRAQVQRHVAKGKRHPHGLRLVHERRGPGDYHGAVGAVTHPAGVSSGIRDKQWRRNGPPRGGASI